MGMKRILAATVVLAFGACATAPAAPKTPSDLILGKWNCKATAEGVTTDAVVTYLEGGKSTLDAKVGVNQGGMAIDIRATAEGNYKFLEDGKVQETITKMTVTSGKMGGNDVPAAMIQPMVEQMVVNQTVTSTATITETSFVSKDEDGTVTTCTR